MLYKLKRHPFPVKAYFDFSLVLTYAFPEKLLAPLLPAGLELDTFKGYGFVAVAMVQTRNLRPAFMPKFMGRDFFLAGYRIFVKYHTRSGKRYRGLFILRSDTNSKIMQFSGNLLTHYNYHTIGVNWEKSDTGIKVISSDPGGSTNVNVEVKFGNENTPLPAHSVFADWKEARRFAGPMPFTFDYEKQTHSIIFIEGVRDNWVPAPVAVEKAEIDFLKLSPFKDAPLLLSNAFVTQHIPYMWKRGVREKLAI
jgi:hypothetical protein